VLKAIAQLVNLNFDFQTSKTKPHRSIILFCAAMNFSWIKNFPLNDYVNSVHDNVTLESPWSILAASVGGLALSGLAGLFLLRHYERLDEQANEHLGISNVVGHVWSCSYQFQMDMPLPIAIQSNMFVIRLRSGKLLIYNPVALPSLLKKQIDAVGEVGIVIVANLGHLKFFSEYLQAYPNVKLVIPPNSLELVLKRLKTNKVAIPVNGIIELRDEKPEGLWDDELEHIIFGGIPWLNEIVLFHEPSKMLITCDTSFNFRDGMLKLKKPNSTPMCCKFGSMFGIYNQLGVSSNYRFLIKDKQAVKATLDQLLKWDFQGIGMAHGIPIAPTDGEDVKGQLQQAWERLL